MSSYVIDWTKCVLCQDVSHESLVKPSDYVSFVNDIDRFSKSGLCPFKLHIDLIGDLEYVVNNLREKGAKWHKVCRNKVGLWKYERAVKRHASACDTKRNEPQKKQTRLSCGGVTASVMTKCLFCNTETGTLHKVSTFDLEEKIRDAALKLDDSLLSQYDLCIKHEDKQFMSMHVHNLLNEAVL